MRAAHRRLVKAYGNFVPKPRIAPLDELITTVLSQHTSDINTARALANLRRRFPSWEQVVDAPTPEVADSIRAGGLADQKAPRIQGILAEIERREGRLSLARLNKMRDEEIVGYLVSLPGVGPKTAACVLTFSLGRQAFPVDTHVHRVALRLGWLPEKTSADAAHRLLTPRIPGELRYELHMLLIRHGREVCIARVPRCEDCVLFDVCPSGPSFLAARDAQTTGVGPAEQHVGGGRAAPTKGDRPPNKGVTVRHLKA